MHREMRIMQVAAISAVVACLAPVARAEPIAVGAQYGTAHVYVAAEDMDRFATSFLATFGGTSSQPADVTVTPTPSSTNWQALTTPVGRSRYSDSRRRFPIRSARSVPATS
jgi:hypothetical protein